MRNRYSRERGGVSSPKLAPGDSALALVEDDEATRGFLVDLLTDAGYSVIEAAEGAAGLALLRAPPNQLVVLIDYRLPDMSGMEILRAVAADARLRRTHACLLVTADARRFSASDQAVQQELGVSAIANPLDIATLLDAVAQAQRHLVEAE